MVTKKQDVSRLEKQQVEGATTLSCFFLFRNHGDRPVIQQLLARVPIKQTTIFSLSDIQQLAVQF